MGGIRTGRACLCRVCRIEFLAVTVEVDLEYPPAPSRNDLAVIPEKMIMQHLDHLLTSSDPGDVINVEGFVGQVVAMAGLQHRERREVIMFAAINQEMWTVDVVDDLAKQLVQEGRLSEHPDVVEMTMVYGACRDGRRWRGQRWLTGARAGQTANVDLLVGRPDARESPGIRSAPLVRALVGLE
jgi:hypothetical protein